MLVCYFMHTKKGILNGTFKRYFVMSLGVIFVYCLQILCLKPKCFRGAGNKVIYSREKLKLFFPEGGATPKDVYFPSRRRGKYESEGVGTFSQEFVILLPPNSAESQNFRGF